MRNCASQFALRAPRNDCLTLSRSPARRILHQIPVFALFADVVLFVVAVAFGGVDGNARSAAGALVAPVVAGNGIDGFCLRFCHWVLGQLRRRNVERRATVPGNAARVTAVKLLSGIK
jgi:hypothetical protein